MFLGWARVVPRVRLSGCREYAGAGNVTTVNTGWMETARGDVQGFARSFSEILKPRAKTGTRACRLPFDRSAKRSSLIQVSAQGAQKLGQIASELAWGEGLPAHARAAELRLDPVPPLRSGK